MVKPSGLFCTLLVSGLKLKLKDRQRRGIAQIPLRFLEKISEMKLKSRTVAKVVDNKSGHDAPIGTNVFINSYASDTHYKVIDQNMCIWNMDDSEIEPTNEPMRIAKNLGKKCRKKR